MARYDVHRVFEDIPRVMGMELVRRGDHWEGGYYLNGDKHTFRKDKLKVAKWNNDIWVHEEGGESLSIANWLQQYGGASDFRHAIEILKGHQVPISVAIPQFRKKSQEVLYVDKDIWRGLSQYDLRKCPLFRWMCTLFPEQRVREVWQRYGVTTDRFGNAVFWFFDCEGRLLHDKRMAYKEDGHRDRDRGAWREFTMSKGYTGKCFFGADYCASFDKAYCCESEKTALLFALYYDKPVMATGGKNALNEVDDRLILLPDMDARAEWDERGTVWPWWEHFEGCGDHDDIGDAIVRRISLHNKK